jgi:membrane protein
MTQPLHELSRFQRTLRFLYDLGRHGARQLQHDRAPQMAGALAFRTLFALLPVLVLGTILIRAFAGFEQLEVWLAEMFTQFGLDDFKVTGASESAVAGGESISQWLLNLVNQVQHINIAAIGWVGLLVVIYSAIGLMVTIEKSFNIIYRAPEGRSWWNRLYIYWAVLTLAPIAIIGAMWIGNLLESFFTERGGWWSVAKAAPAVWNFLVLWMVTFFVYKLIPNTNVTYRPGLFGALLAAVLLEVGKRTLGAYFAKAVLVGQLYGSLGLIPVFMFWVYVMWLIVLFGLEVSASLQMLRGRRLEELDGHRTGLVDPTSVLLVMQVVARYFETSQPTTAREIADEVSISEQTVILMLDDLITAGIVHRLDQDGAIAMARPPDQVSAEELLEIGYRMCDESEASRASSIIRRLRDAQKGLAGQITLDKMAEQSV